MFFLPSFTFLSFSFIYTFFPRFIWFMFILPLLLSIFLFYVASPFHPFLNLYFTISLSFSVYPYLHFISPSSLLLFLWSISHSFPSFLSIISVSSLSLFISFSLFVLCLYLFIFTKSSSYFFSFSLLSLLFSVFLPFFSLSFSLFFFSFSPSILFSLSLPLLFSHLPFFTFFPSFLSPSSPLSSSPLPSFLYSFLSMSLLHYYQFLLLFFRFSLLECSTSQSRNRNDKN